MNTDVILMQDFCTAKGFFYYLTRESLDFQNLLDESFKGVYCFHAQGRINLTQSASGFVSNKTYTGRLYFSVPSNIDGIIHEDKYQNTVYNIDRLEIHKMLNAYFCKDYVFRLTNAQPFYNLFNINYDGISFDYEVEINEPSDLTDLQKTEFITNGKLL
jgi:hypothetical protein